MNPMFESSKKADGAGKQDMFEEFEASELYCPRCKIATPVRKRLLLILPEGEKYEYLCSRCATSLGGKIDYKSQAKKIIITD